jgi:glutamate racemase
MNERKLLAGTVGRIKLGLVISCPSWACPVMGVVVPAFLAACRSRRQIDVCATGGCLEHYTVLSSMYAFTLREAVASYPMTASPGLMIIHDICLRG